MGFVGFLDFVLKCIQLLAWPSFALGYPLCASIRAIETNSDFHMRKLVAYWIFFSLISLFEYAFSKLLEWVPVWPYVKILAIFLLVIPGFNGASIAYDNIVRPCLSMNLPQIIVDMLNEKQYVSLTRESFLEEAEKYVKENGTEALEKFFASKTIINEPPVAEKDIKPVEILHKSTAAAENKIINQTTPIVFGSIPPVAQKDIKPVEILHKSTAAAENKTILNEPPVAQKDIKPVEILNKSTEAAENKITTIVDADIKVNNAKLPEKLTENAFLVPPAFKNVQKEWNCAVCQITTQSEATLNSHLQGKKHRTKCEELKAGKQTATEKGVSTGTPNRERNCEISEVTTQSKTTWTSLHLEFIEGKQTAIENNSSSTTIKSEQPNHDLKKVSSDSGINKTIINEPPIAQKDIKPVEILNKSTEAAENKITTTVDADIKVNNAKLPEKLTENAFLVPPAFKNVQKEWTCALCQVTTQSEATLNSHLHGLKHRTKCEELKAGKQTATKKGVSTGIPNLERNCEISQVTTRSKTTWTSPHQEFIEGKQSPNLQGTKHKSKSEQLKARETTEKDKITSPAKYSDKKSSGLNKNLSAIAKVNIEVNIINGFHSCSICNVTCSSESDMAIHLGGKRHLSEIEDSGHTRGVHYWCNICDVKCLSEIDMASHLNGKTHVMLRRIWVP